MHDSTRQPGVPGVQSGAAGETANLNDPLKVPAAPQTSRRKTLQDYIADPPPTGQVPASSIDIIRIDENEVAVVPFTNETVEVDSHFSSDDEVFGYLRCNGKGCVLCMIGRKLLPRVILPVYSTAERRVGVLMMSASRRPGALLPQLVPALRSKARILAFIARHGTRFSVQVKPLPPDVEDGAHLIRAFQEADAAGTISLVDALQSISNDELRAIPAIQEQLRLRGLE